MRTSLSSAAAQPWGIVLYGGAGSQHGSNVRFVVQNTNRQNNSVAFTDIVAHQNGYRVWQSQINWLNFFFCWSWFCSKGHRPFVFTMLIRTGGEGVFCICVCAFCSPLPLLTSQSTILMNQMYHFLTALRGQVPGVKGATSGVCLNHCFLGSNDLKPFSASPLLSHLALWKPNALFFSQSAHFKFPSVVKISSLGQSELYFESRAG